MLCNRPFHWIAEGIAEKKKYNDVPSNAYLLVRYYKQAGPAEMHCPTHG
jgi:hypothetical protein